MDLGFVSAILDESSYQEMMDTAAALGYTSVEVACWPTGKAERRYAGVCHINVERVLEDEVYLHEICAYAAEKNVKITSLAYYSNPLHSDLSKREEVIAHLKNVILASGRMGIGMVTTFLGRMQDQTVERNLEEVKLVWPGILSFARDHGVRIAIENCPMLFGPDQWPGGQNLMTTPANWRDIFEVLPDANLGINYDPSHFVWQFIDYVQPLYEFRDRIWHVHFKDIKLFANKLSDVGTMAYPLSYMSPKLPGLGDVNWGMFISALTDIQYHGPMCVEVEDKAFEQTLEKKMDALRLSKKHLEQFLA